MPRAGLSGLGRTLEDSRPSSSRDALKGRASLAQAAVRASLDTPSDGLDSRFRTDSIFRPPKEKKLKHIPMNRALTLILVLLLGTCLLAQSSNSKFIDSPSWILAGEGSLDGMPSPVPAMPGEKSSGSKAGAGRGNAMQASSARGSRNPSSPSDEGFLHIGIYVTPTLNWLSSVDKGDNGTKLYERTGSNFAATPTVMLDMRLFRRFYVGVGVAYNTWGGKISLINGEHDFKRSFSFSYVEVPVRVKLQTRNFADSRASMFFSVGANLGFGVDYFYRDKYKDLGITSPVSATGDFVTQKYPLKEDSKLANFSVAGQIGVNYQIGRRMNFLIGIEYHYGFVRPLKEHAAGPDFNNQQIGLVLGFMF